VHTLQWFISTYISSEFISINKLKNKNFILQDNLAMVYENEDCNYPFSNIGTLLAKTLGREDKLQPIYEKSVTLLDNDKVRNPVVQHLVLHKAVLAYRTQNLEDEFLYIITDILSIGHSLDEYRNRLHTRYSIHNFGTEEEAIEAIVDLARANPAELLQEVPNNNFITQDEINSDDIPY